MLIYLYLVLLQIHKYKVNLVLHLPERAISGLSSRDVGNPYIVYGISVNKLIYREQWDDKPDIAV